MILNYSRDKKINSNKTKHLLVENEFKKLEKFDAAYFRVKNYFDGDGTQNYLVFQLMYRYFKMIGNEISSWESKGLSNEKISFITTSSFNFSPTSVYHNARIRPKFDGYFFGENDNAAYNHRPIVYSYCL